MNDRKVAITGIGVIGPCGIGKDLLWEYVSGAKSAISEKTDDDPEMIPVAEAGFVRDFAPRKLIAQKKSLKVMCRDIQMAVAASHLAADDGGLDNESIVSDRSGTCIGAGIFEHDPEEMADSFKVSVGEDAEFDSVKFGAEGMSQLFPLWLLKYLPNMPACHITIAHGLRGPSNTLTADSSGSAAALEESFRVIKRGTADLMFAGGSECRLHGEGLLKYHSQGILSGGKSENYRVFSRDDNGIIAGEGGTILILEESGKAKERSAKIYAEIAACGSVADIHGVEKSSAEDRSASIARLMRSVLKKAGIEAAEVSAIHLNARGVLDEDRIEANAIHQVFGDLNEASRPFLVGLKPVTGYLGFAAAPTEVLLAAISLHKQKLAPSPWIQKSLLESGYPVSDGSARQLKYILVHHFENNLSDHIILLKAAGNE